MIERVYTAAIQGLQTAFPLLGRGSGKIARGIRGRREVLESMRRWAEEERDESRQLVWFHAPSVGEGLQAAAVLERVREMRPDVQIVYTYFSPSAESLARRVPADFAAYLPLDTPAAVGRALDLLRPAAIVFSKTDVWPNLTREARRRGVRLAMISGTLPATSSKLGPLARRLLRHGHARLDVVGAIAEEDAERFGLLGVAPERRVVMGDAHYDRVLARAAAVDRSSALLARLRPRLPVVVAGSTWPADEERLLPAVAALRGSGVDAGLILVPHEPTEAHLLDSERRLRALDLPAIRLRDLAGDWSGREVLIVDRVGVLGELYALADLAYVGGGFGTAGLHSVLEPAAFGAPVLFGPKHANAREAEALIEAGGAVEVDGGDALEIWLGGWLEGDAARRAAGERARAFVERGRGAADRGADLVLSLLA